MKERQSTFIVFFQIPNYSQKVHKQCKFVMFVIFPINDNNIFRFKQFFDRFQKYLFFLYGRWSNKLSHVCFHSIQVVWRSLSRMWNSVGFFVNKIKYFYLIRLIERIIGQLIDYQMNR